MKLPGFAGLRKIVIGERGVTYLFGAIQRHLDHLHEDRNQAVRAKHLRNPNQVLGMPVKANNEDKKRQKKEKKRREKQKRDATNKKDEKRQQNRERRARSRENNRAAKADEEAVGAAAAKGKGKGKGKKGKRSGSRDQSVPRANDPNRLKLPDYPPDL